jgi:glycosyl hydrolase family 2
VLTYCHRLLAAVIALGLLAAATAAPAGAAYVAQRPQARTLYHDGPSGRYLLGGKWLFRLDPTGVGLAQRFQRQVSDAGWAPVAVPNAWNATDSSEESFMGTAGWYRKDFRLPSAARRLAWVVRFESVNYRSRIWLNGRLLGTNRGAYLPFELRLPPSVLKRAGVNRLVIRVDNRRYGTDFPPSGLSTAGKPTGGWWNYGGLLREVYLRKVDGVDFTTVQVRPLLACAKCPATIAYRVTLRNSSDKPLRVHLTGRYGRRRVDLGVAGIGPKRFATFTRSIVIRRPRLWSPARPYLYDTSLQARAGGRVSQTYVLRSGIRSIRVSGDGHLLLNGQVLDFRGVGLHEDSERYGFAIGNAIRDRQLAEIRALGATLVRSHYPLHPYFQEQADRLGIMLWSEIPVYSVRTQYLKQRLVRELAARELQTNILVNQNHPSVIVWSIGNELSARPGPIQSYYITRAASAAHALDPTRPVGYAVAAYPGAGCQKEYAPLDVLGLNEYFGWYPGPNGQIADRSTLTEYLDSIRQCYPKKAIVISEFGAEANRDGPVEERGTYAYQQDFVNFHLGVYATKPWLSGAVYWALQEFRVRPGWQGGNPRPQPPIHQKGLVTFDGRRKPAFFDAQRLFRATEQLRSPRR